MSLRYSSLLLVLPLCACATIFNGKTQSLKIDATTPATAVSITDKHKAQVMSVVTPAEVELKGNDAPYVLRFRNTAGKQHDYEVKPAVSGWVFGNVILGGIIGFGIDAATGSLYRLKPDTVNLDMATGVNLAYPAKAEAKPAK